MKAPAPADLQRWSDDVARDPASLSFLPLARAYRKQGRRDAAFRLCMRGLEQHPANVEAHSLLAVLYFESGQRVKAYDEWSMVLTIDADNFDALRGMGFYYLEQADYATAKRHLERAALQKPRDPAVQEALRIIRERLGETQHEEPRVLEAWEQEAQAWSPVTSSPPVAAVAVAPEPSSTSVPVLDEPAQLFAPLLKGGQVRGALLLDNQGLILAGTLGGELGPQAEALGAALGGAIEEAVRACTHLSLGGWNGVLLEADEAVLHFAPVGPTMIVLVAARKNAPTGWVLRAAQQASTLARQFLEANT